VQGPIRKKYVLREAKEDERLPERKVVRTEGNSSFQREETIEAKDRG